MTEAQLQKLVEEISLKFFRRPFRHRAIFNKRLKTTGGRYHCLIIILILIRHYLPEYPDK